MNPTIAIMGAGNMGSSLIGGLIKNGHPPHQLIATDAHPEKLAQLQTTLRIQTTTDNVQAVQSADIIVFAIKPQHFANLAKEIAPFLANRSCLVISIASGIRIASIQSWLGEKVAIVRAMPNTPALIGCGATGLYANSFVTPDQHNVAESILRAVGITVWLKDENLMDTVTALSGSGPAYFFLVMEALQQAGEQFGLSKDVARLLTLQTALGAARMAIESGKPLEELRLNVTSPGGTTEKAIAVLEEKQLRDLFQKALQAAKQRSEELAQIIVNDKV